MTDHAVPIEDLPNIDPEALQPIDIAALAGDGAPAHPPRILLLYGSLRERSFSRFAAEEAGRLLRWFGAETRTFDVESYRHAIRLWTITLEISVLMAQFPSREIARRFAARQTKRHTTTCHSSAECPTVRSSRCRSAAVRRGAAQPTTSPGCKRFRGCSHGTRCG